MGQKQVGAAMKQRCLQALNTALFVGAFLALLVNESACCREKDFPWRDVDALMPSSGWVTVRHTGHWESPPSEFLPVIVDKHGNFSLPSSHGAVAIDGRRIAAAIGHENQDQRGIIILVGADAPVEALTNAYALANTQKAYIMFLCKAGIAANNGRPIYTWVDGGVLPFMTVGGKYSINDLIVEPTNAWYQGESVTPYNIAERVRRASNTVPEGRRLVISVRVRKGTLSSCYLQYAAAFSRDHINFMLTVEE